MKKSLIFAGAIFLTSGIAIAKTIDFDTSIKWNSNVVELALNKSGFLGSSDAHWDVRVTHERILAELLKMESFSLRDATRVCLDKCNMSDFLKNGRGASGKKCPDLCSGFADTLVSVNNELMLKFDEKSISDYNKTVFKKITVFKDIQTYGPYVALSIIKQYIERHDLAKYVVCDKNPKCKTFGQDVIHCDLDGKRYLFEFDDICNNEIGIIDKPILSNANDAYGVDRAWFDAPLLPFAIVTKSAAGVESLITGGDIETLLQRKP